jgi:predicted AlkP superfamily pyrophosphatase or phosphodiesterase
MLAATSLVLATVAAQLGAAASSGAAPDASRDDRPRLAVVCVIDQMIPEHLDRLRGLWSGGFKRFVEQGRRFTAAAYDYAGTETCPGHTTIGTGRMPWRHGIVANDWIDRATKSGVYCVADASVQPVRQSAGSTSGGRSPRSIHGLGLSDFIEAADSLAHTITLSTKDRAAIGLGGQHPDLTLWWDLGGSGFMTSTWFAAELPPFVRAWNDGWLERVRASDFGTRWSSTLPAELAGTSTAEDDRSGEADFLAKRHTFPYDAPNASDPPSDKDRARWANFVYHTPLADRCVLELACRAVETLGLGTDDHVDYLAVSCSACDIVGHATGPYSREVTDLLLRDDRELGKLFALLDEKVGAGRWIAVLSADHGVMELPEALVGAGVEAGRVSAAELAAAVKATRAAVAERFGGDFFAGSDTSGLWFSAAAMRAKNVDAKDVRALAKAAFVAAAPWCERAFTADELAANASEPIPAALRLQRHSFDPERSADVLFEPRRGWLVAVEIGTSHGTPNAYDRRVPLVFLGAGVAAGEDPRPASPVDIVPTLMSALGLGERADLEGRALPLR